MTRRVRATHTFASVAGWALTAMWLLVVVGHLFGPDDEGFTLEGAVLGMLVLVAAGGFILSRRHGQLGASVTVIAGCLLGVFAAATAGRNHWFAVLVSGVPWVVVGASLLWVERRAAGSGQVAGTQ